MFTIRTAKTKKENSLLKRLKDLEELLEKYSDNYPIKEKILQDIQEILESLKIK